jgi:hypothetical protein
MPLDASIYDPDSEDFDETGAVVGCDCWIWRLVATEVLGLP